MTINHFNYSLKKLTEEQIEAFKKRLFLEALQSIKEKEKPEPSKSGNG